jgi:hypothetical protein
MPMQAQKGDDVQLQPTRNFGATRGGWLAPRPGLLSPEKTRYPLYRRLGGPQGQSGRARKMSCPAGFDPRTTQTAASCYTGCAIPAAIYIYIILSYNKQNFNKAVPHVTTGRARLPVISFCRESGYTRFGSTYCS